MEGYQKLREELGAAALRMKYAMLAMGLVPLVFLAVEVALKIFVPAQSLAEMRGTLPQIPIVVAFAAVSIAAVFVAPRLVYNAFVRRQISSPPADDPGRNPGIIIAFLALAVTPSDLGLVLFFLSNLWVTIPFHLLALLGVWRFNLNIQSFLDDLARDLTGESGPSR